MYSQRAATAGKSLDFQSVAMAEKRFKHGERILLGIPESGRFSMSYVLLTYLEPGAV